MLSRSATPLGAALGTLLLSLSLAAADLPSPALLVLEKEDNALAIVDPATRKATGRVATGEGPHEIAVSSDGKFAYVSNYGTGQKPGHTLSIIDLAARKERRIDLAPLGRPHGIFFADGKVYFTSEANKLIGRYDPAGDKIDWLLGTGQNGTHMVLLSPDRSRIFTANIGSDSITILERAPAPLDWNAAVVPVGKGPEALDLSPDGKELWTAHSRDGGVSVIDVAARKVIAVFDAGTRRSNRLKFTPDGKRVLVTDLAGGELVVIDAASRKEIKRIPLGRNPEGILIPPAGNLAYVAVAGDDNVAILDLATLSIAGRIPAGRGPDGLAWVP